MAKVLILITLLLQVFCMLLIEVFGQSPCPQYFMYINDSTTGEVIGQIKIPSPPKNVELHLRVALSIAVELPSRYVGRLELAESKEESVQVIQQGKPLLYHIYFPVSQPFPLLTGLIFNGQVYCSGPRAVGRVVTSIMLEHTLYPPNIVPLSQNSHPVYATHPTNRPTTQRPTKKPTTTIGPTTSIGLSEGISNNVFLNSAQQNANNICGVSTHTNNINLLISKGIETSPGQWPWLVAIFIVKLEFKFQCAGSLVTNKHIITAAHCCKIGQTNHDVPPSVLYVSLGRYRLREWYEPGSVNQEIVNYTIHPDYTHTGSGDSDLAILVLRTPVQFSPIIKPVCMWFGETNLQSVVNKSGYVVGWGRDEFGNPYLAEPRMARVPIASQMEISDSCSTISTPQTLQREMEKDDNNSIISTFQKSSTKCNVLKRKIGSDSEDSSSKFEDSNSKKEYKRRRSEHHISSNISRTPSDTLHIRMDQLHDDINKFYKKLSKNIKHIKNSILYDFNKKIEAIKNTIAYNATLIVEDEIKKHRENLGIKFPITTYEEFVEFDTIIKENNDKSTALKAIMVSYLGNGTELKEAVRKILGNLPTKAVQELYSAAGRKGPNGVIKKNFSATHFYSCMTDVIISRILKADAKTILSTSSRYLSAVVDREGGKAIRDAKKYKNTS